MSANFAEYWGKFTVGQIIKFNEIIEERADETQE